MKKLITILAVFMFFLPKLTLAFDFEFEDVTVTNSNSVRQQIYDVNNFGHYIITTDNANFHFNGNTLVEVPFPSGEWSVVWLLGLNDSDEIVGFAINGENTYPFKYVDGQYYDVTPQNVPYPNPRSFAVLSINNNGDLLGNFVCDEGYIGWVLRDGTYHYFSPGDYFSGLYPQDINENGMVAGYGRTSDGLYKAFTYDSVNGQGIINPPISYSPGLHTSFGGINDHGLIVGVTYKPSRKLFIYDGENFYDVNLPDQEGISYIFECAGINNFNTVTSTVSYSTGRKAFLTYDVTPKELDVGVILLKAREPGMDSSFRFSSDFESPYLNLFDGETVEVKITVEFSGIRIDGRDLILKNESLLTVKDLPTYKLIK